MADIDPTEVDRDLLTREYFHLHSVIEAFDGKTLTIKAWSVTLSMAGIGAAYLNEKQEILLLAAGSALLFWIIEGLWKTFQQAYYARIDEIERFLAGDSPSIRVPQISTSWNKSWNEERRTRLATVLLWPHVYLPHGVVFVVGVLLYCVPILVAALTEK